MATHTAIDPLLAAQPSEDFSMTKTVSIPKLKDSHGYVRAQKAIRVGRADMTGKQAQLVPAGTTHTVAPGHRVDVFTVGPEKAIRYYNTSPLELTGPLFFRAKKKTMPSLLHRLIHTDSDNLLTIVSAGFPGVLALILSALVEEDMTWFLFLTGMTLVSIAGVITYAQTAPQSLCTQLRNPTPEQIAKLPGVTHEDVFGTSTATELEKTDPPSGDEVA